MALPLEGKLAQACQMLEEALALHPSLARGEAWRLRQALKGRECG